MAAAYLHGVEVLPADNGNRPVSVIRSSVVGLVGIAPRGVTQTLVAVNDDTTASQFGKELPGFTIPQAIKAVFQQQVTTILVVNVFNETDHTTAVADEVFAISGGKGKLAFPPVQAGYGATVVIKNNADEVQEWEYGTDYTIDDYGNFTALTVTPADAADYKVSYKKLNAGNVTSGNIIGTVTGSTRTGMKLWQQAYSLFGYKPKILMTPGFSSVNAVAAQLIVEADYYKGTALLDAPIGTSIANAIAGRGVAGAINFNTSNKRTQLLFPGVKAYDEYTDANQVRPYSPYFAGIIAQVDQAFGPHESPSNRAIKGIDGIEIPITFDPGDTTGTTETNQLNAVGITTIANAFGTGQLTWGNRNASFPTNTGADSFTSVQRTRDVVEESIQYYSLQYGDKPLTRPQIDDVVENVNNFMRTLKQRGWIIDGSVTFDSTINTTTTLTAGQVIYTIDFMPPTPGERQTYLSSLNTDYLTQLLNPGS